MVPIYEFAEMKLTRRVGLIWWGAFLVAAGMTGSCGIVVWVVANGPPETLFGQTWAGVVVGFLFTTGAITVGLALLALSRYRPDRTFVSRERARAPWTKDPSQ